METSLKIWVEDVEGDIYFLHSVDIGEQSFGEGNEGI